MALFFGVAGAYNRFDQGLWTDSSHGSAAFVENQTIHIEGDVCEDHFGLSPRKTYCTD